MYNANFVYLLDILKRITQNGSAWWQNGVTNKKTCFKIYIYIIIYKVSESTVCRLSIKFNN